MPKLNVRSRVGDSCRNRLSPAPKTVQVIADGNIEEPVERTHPGEARHDR